MSGIRKTPFSWRMRSASGVTGPLAASAMILVRTACAFSSVMAFSSAAGIRISHSSAKSSAGVISSAAELLALECEILIPAALENAITEENAHAVHTKIIAEAANGPVTPEADRILNQKGVFLIPDILCNAGGVTVSYFEWVQDENHLFWDEQD